MENKHMQKLRKAVVGMYTMETKDWADFRMEVERMYPDFRKEMHEELLNGREYKICLLLKAGFRPVEIEILLGYKPKTLATYQRRLLKKIFDTDGSAKELRERVTSAGHEERIMRRYCG